MGFLSGKRILITGISSKFSIAYGIAKVMYREGAELAFSCKNYKLKSRIKKLLNPCIILECDVEKDESINLLFSNLSKKWEKFDGFVHSIAFAPKEQLFGDYIDSITRDGFKVTHDISVYSFVAMTKYCREMLNSNSSLLTISYLGSERAIPNYNVMGLAKASLEANVRYMANALGSSNIRVNAISSGPIRTLSTSKIKNFRKVLHHYKNFSPIRRNVSIEEIGNSAAFLCSNLSSGITGEVIHVDGGFSIAMMNELE